MKRLLFLSLLLANSVAMAGYQSSYATIEWEQRGNDSNYCLDIVDEAGNIAYGLKAITCGDGLHTFAPQAYVRETLNIDLPTGFSFFWKVWSPSGYGQAGFEGQVVVGGGCQGQGYSSTAEALQWDCRGQDSNYCVDILDANGMMLNQAVACGEGLHSYAPSNLNLPAGTYNWKVASNSGYGQAGFEGSFQIGASNSAQAVGGQLYATNCASCHGNNPVTQGRNSIQRGVNPMATRNAINGNKGGMNFLGFLSDTELANIAAYIQNPQ